MRETPETVRTAVAQMVWCAIKPETLWYFRTFRRAILTVHGGLFRACPRSEAAENITWGEERIADELKLKLGIRAAPSRACG